jgi:hypothetical protein
MRQRDIPYQQVEYLQSDSSAYIDTGIGGSDDLEIDCVFRYTKYTMNGAIYGNWIDDQTNMVRLIVSNDATILSDYFNTLRNNLKIVAGMNTKYHYQSDYLRIQINSEEIIRDYFPKGNLNNTNIALFNRSVANPNTSRDIGLQIYSFKISKSGEVLRDFVPVRVGVVGYMYDKVSKQLFENVGTGQFILGPNV